MKGEGAGKAMKDAGLLHRSASLERWSTAADSDLGLGLIGMISLSVPVQ